jgi:hypothetical protein
LLSLISAGEPRRSCRRQSLSGQTISAIDAKCGQFVNIYFVIFQSPVAAWVSTREWRE